MGNAKDKLDDKGREKIQCLICGNWYHRVDVHVKKKHAMTAEDYVAKYPGAPTISDTAVKLGWPGTGAKRPARTGPKKSKAAKKLLKKTKSTKDSFRLGVATLGMRGELEEAEKPLVPVHDDDWSVDDVVMRLWEDIAIGIEDNEPVYVGGPTGCGKSAGINELAAVINQPVLRVNLNRDFKVSQFVGRTDLKLDENGNQFTEFKYGVLPQAIKNGWWLLLDEIDQAHPDVLMALQAVLEGQPLVLTENFGEIVDPKADDRSKNFRILATANTFGKGDDTGLYNGAKIMNEATLDRFGVTVKATYPQKNSEAKILQKKAGIEADVALKMVTIAHKIREAFLKEECSCTFSTRRLIMWAKKYSRYNDIRRAAEISVLNKLDDDDARLLTDLIQRHFGGEVS